MTEPENIMEEAEMTESEKYMTEALLEAEKALAAGEGIALPGADLDLLTGDCIGDLTGKQGIMLLAGVRQQHGILLQFQRHVGFQHQRPHIVGAGRHRNSAAQVAQIDGTLNGGGIIGLTVTHSAEVTNAYSGGFGECPEFKGKILAVGFSTHRVAAVNYAPRYPGVDAGG